MRPVRCDCGNTRFIKGLDSVIIGRDYKAYCNIRCTYCGAIFDDSDYVSTQKNKQRIGTLDIEYHGFVRRNRPSLDRGMRVNPSMFVLECARGAFG